MNADPTRLTPEDLPARFGRYLLTGLLGEGGMGRVFRAELQGPAGFRKELAIKVLRPEALEGRDDFVREARLGGLLKHPNLVDVYEFDAVDDRLFLVMELVRGISLQAALRQRVTLPPRALLQVGRQICVALAHAHGLRVAGKPAGLVHSDLKPANVLLGRDGLVKVADLGVAWAAGLFGALPADTLRGTLSWMAPEQILGEPVDHRADLFALGTVLTVAALGHHPFRRTSMPVTAAAVVDVEDTLAQYRVGEQLDAVLPGLGEVVLHCLRRNPDHRPATAGALAAALGRLRPRDPEGLAEVLTDLLPDVAADELVSITAPAPPSESHFNALPLGPRTNIEDDEAPFFGRVTELEELAALIDGGARLVTLKATGGAGKSRLSRRFALARAPALDGGAWFVPLLEVREDAGLRGAVADALGLHNAPSDDDGLVAALAQRGPTLLVLDNAEHLTDVLTAPVARWLAGAPALSLLVTSRRGLGLPTERVLELGPLSPAEGTALFRERAVRTHPGWVPGPDDLDQLPELTRRLDGMPLALELAAARVGSLPVRELIARLGERFKLLVDRDAPDPRRAALSSVLGWSWEQLKPWEQAAMGQLTVFVGGFTLDEAESVLSLRAWPDAPWAVDVVGELARQSMLTSQPVDGRPRYDQYETVRAWARRDIDPADLDAARDRHARAFAQLGSPAAIRDLRRRGGGSKLRRLVRELENLVVACEHAVEQGDVSTAASACVALLHALEVAGPAVVADNLAGRVGALDDLSDRDRARVLLASGWIRRRTSFSGARRRLERARELAEAAGDTEVALQARLWWASLGMGSGGDPDLDARLGALADEYEDRGDAGGAGIARAMQGSVLYLRGRLQEARVALEEALEGVRDHADRGSELSVRASLGTVCMALGRHADAAREYELSLRLARSTGERFREGVILGNLGALAMCEDQPRAARRYLREAAVIHRHVGARAQEGICLLNLGEILTEEGRTDEAIVQLERAVELCRRTWPMGSGAGEAMLAVQAARAGRHEDAAGHMERSEAYLAGDVDRLEQGKARARGAEVAWRAGDPERAARALAEASAIRDEIGAEPESGFSRLLAELAALID